MNKKIKRMQELLKQKKNQMEDLLSNAQCYKSPYMEEILELQVDIDELEEKVNGSKRKVF